MANEDLKFHEQPFVDESSLVIGLSGWMDGGDVSTGTIEYLVDKLDAGILAEIESRDFYIYNFPGSMEMSALFRPHARVEDGLIQEFDEVSNTFYYDEEHRLILFEGKEPNLHWDRYANCILEVATRFNVNMIAFAGSVSSLVPHTREPRFHSSFSKEELRSTMVGNGLNPSNYEGPASVITYLMTRARERDLAMATIVAEIPAYVQGKNIKCIESVTRKLASVLELSIDLDDMTPRSTRFLEGLEKVVAQKKELANHIRMIEEAYDKDDEESRNDLRSWFEKQDIQLD